MKAFYKIPLEFEINRLQETLAQFNETDWLKNPLDNSGLASIILVSVGGTLNHDFAIAGQMAPTPYLQQCPYLQQLLTTFNRPISRSRLVRLQGTSQTPLLAHRHYHWLRRNAIYIPIMADPTLQFSYHHQDVTVNVGEAWVVDHSYPYTLVNPSKQECVCWVIETRKTELPLDLTLLSNSLPIEPYCFEVLTPSEIETLITNILSDIKNSEITPDNLLALHQITQHFKQQWQQIFEHFGHQPQGELAYQTLILDFQEQIVSKINHYLTSRRETEQAVAFIHSMLLTTDRPISKHRNQKSLSLAKTKYRIKSKLIDELPEDFQGPEFTKPIFIVSAPRAGSTLLFETLSKFTELWTIAEESHEVIEGIAEFHPAAKNFSSNRLTAAEVTAALAVRLRHRFVQQLQAATGEIYLDLPVEKRPIHIRFLEKTPKNALRIPFLRAVFPQALFIYLYRDPYENIASLVEGWRSRRFIAYHQLPAWPYRGWSFLLPPGWPSLQESSLVEIAAYQWKMANTCILEDLQQLPATTWHAVYYTDFIEQPRKTIKAISEFAALQWHPTIEQFTSRPLPMSQLTLSAPASDKWRKYEPQLTALLPMLAPTIQWATALVTP